MPDIKLGAVDRSVPVFIPDPASTDGSGKTGLVAANLTVSYTRVETDNDVIVTDVTSSLSNLSALTDAHADWGLKEVSSTLAPGLYRLDIADAVFASGAWYAVVYVMITSSAAAASPILFTLIAFDALDAVRLGLTALPNAGADAAGGLIVSDAGGLDADAQRADVVAILVDTAEIGAAGAGLTNINLPNQTMDIVGNITGNMSGSVGSVTGAVGSVTGLTASNLDTTISSRATPAQVNAEADTALSDYDPPTRAELTSDTNSILSKLLKYVQLVLRKDSAIATDNATEVTALNADGGSGAGAFANTTDSQEALRDRGDAAWITATGFSTHSAADVWAVATRTLTAFDASFKTGYALSAAGVQAIWDALTSALTTVGSIGKLLVDNINATISSRLASASYTTPPTVGAIADQVWEEAVADHSGTVGSTAEALAAAGSAGDPWVTALPGAYGAGSAGKIVGDNLNATISSRATPAQVNTEADLALSDVGLTPTVTGRIDAAVSTRASQTSVDALPTNAELAAALAAGVNVTEINGTTLIGDGQIATPWGPA